MADLVQIERITKSEFHARVVGLSQQRENSYRRSQFPLERLSKQLEQRLVTNASMPVPECTNCGLCCFLPLIVPVTRDESERLTSYCDILMDGADADIVVDRMLPRAGDGRCLNLEGKLGASIGCTIYKDRPQVCRDFEAGSDRCHEYRRMFEFEDQLTEEQIETAIQRLANVERPITVEEVSIVSTGKIERSSFNILDGTVEYTTAEQLTIVAFLGDEKPHELHTFEYGKENWFESDLLGLTIEQANEKIAEQAGW